jgi:NifU-like protein
MVYPPQIAARINKLTVYRPINDSDGTAVGANFECGSAIRVFLCVDDKAGLIVNAGFLSNGCGYMLAAADVLTLYLRGRQLAELHGLRVGDLRAFVEKELIAFPDDRRGCLEACIEALRAAFADALQRRIEEFTGEKALICTCFGVSEETVERVIAEQDPKNVEDVTRVTRAGGGCGACLFLIRDMLDMHRHTDLDGT